MTLSPIPCVCRRLLGVAVFVAAAVAQQGADAKRPEQGDPLPDCALVAAATAAKTTTHALLAAAPTDAPLVIAFVHKDKDLCSRFLQELKKEVLGMGDGRARCAIHLVFSGAEQEGATVAIARDLPAPFQVHWDPDRSAYTAMGLIAFPTVYVVDRATHRIETLRRGYKISLAQEVVARLQVALGAMTQEQFAQLEQPAQDVPAPVRQHTTKLRQAQQLLRTGKPEIALTMFEALLVDNPGDLPAQAGRAIAKGKLGHGDAYELLVAVSKEQPDEAGVTLALGEWLLDHERLDEAEPLVRSVLGREPAPAWFALGRLHERRGEWKAAAQAYRESARRLLH